MSYYGYTPKKGEKHIYITYEPMTGYYGWRCVRDGLWVDSKSSEYDTRQEAIKAAQWAYPRATIVDHYGSQVIRR